MIENRAFPSSLRPIRQPVRRRQADRRCARPGALRFLRGAGASLAIVLAAATAAPAIAKAQPFVDDAGRTVEIPDRISRVLAAGPPASVLVYVLAPEKLVGWTRVPTPREKEFLIPAARSLPALGRLTGHGGTMSLDTVKAARPDIIIDVGTVSAPFIAIADRVQERTGIPYVLMDGSLAATPQSLRRVGALLGVSPRSEELAAYAQDTLATLKGTLAAIPAAGRPRVYYARGAKGFETGLAGAINLEALDMVGASNVAAALGKGGLTTVSIEQVIEWNPQVILAATAGFARVVVTDPIWKDIAAVRNGRVHTIPSLPFGWIDAPPGVNRLIGIRWLEALLYPNVFDLNLKVEVRRFFRLFYQVDLTDDQLHSLMTEAMPAR